MDSSFCLSTQRWQVCKPETQNGRLRSGDGWRVLEVRSSQPTPAPAKVQELDPVVGWRRAPSPDDHQRLPYTNAVLLQIQRFISVVPLGLPRSPSTPTCTASLPKGAH
ncbi:cytochrome P450 2A12-like [Macaca thibetana thibetana]|uniref:cytochrome P450 2A12-like n=1 Tax=Macaca thibetana thibetana TaxID=257877 RepID=UPI0021BCCACC|nr:cytochrome P450 2A12-like [Macaca thibetana thibetana]